MSTTLKSEKNAKRSFYSRFPVIADDKNLDSIEILNLIQINLT